MSGSSLKNFHMFEALTGNQFKNIVLTTTMWDEVDQATGQRREEELKRTYWSAMIARGSCTQRFDGTTSSALNIIQPLIDDPGKPYVLFLQKEVNELGKVLPQTNAGAILELQYHNLAQQHQELRDKIQKELNGPGRDDQQLQKWLDEYRALSIALQSVPTDVKMSGSRPPTRWRRIEQIFRR